MKGMKLTFADELRMERAKFITRRWFFRQCGVGLGSIALGTLLGAVLRSLAEQRQVVVVTHLAQVAEAAEHHLRITKHSASGASESVVEVITGAERRRELIAMAGARPGAGRAASHPEVAS